MTDPVQFELTVEEVARLQQLWSSVSDFRDLLDSLADTLRSVEHNQQFNQFRLETKALLGGTLTEDIPQAITGDVTTDRSISLIVILGVILALVGLGINAIILEDVLVNSLGCCISSGGMLLVVGAFVVLSMKNARQRVNNIADLRRRCDLLLLQIEHRVKMGEVREEQPYP
jgi:hypothetical protein